MWVAGVVIVLAIGVGLDVAVGRRAEPPPGGQPWRTAGLGGMFVDIAGTLAGFSIASAIFIASTNQNRDSPAYASVVGMLLISFLILMSTAMMYSSTPTDPAADDAHTTTFSR